MMRQDEPPAVPVYASFARRFWPLFAAGLAGIAALPLIVMPLLEARMRAGVPPGMSLGTLTALSLIQPAVLLARLRTSSRTSTSGERCAVNGRSHWRQVS